MANVAVTSDAWTELSITSGTVQNVSATAEIELSSEQTDNSGVVLRPSEIYQWDNETIYARAVTESTGALRVVNFKRAAGGGGYVLPVATASTLGGVKVGDNLSIDGDGVLSAPVSYSTTEKQIGTWIDGKPLYQITLEDTMPTINTEGTATTKDVDISALSAKSIINITGILWSSASSYVTINSITGAAPTFRCAFCTKVDTSKPYIDTLRIRENSIPHSNAPCYITLQYTKTTD